MSVLALYLEQEGIATTIVSLVRLHSEKVRPPRSVWVPYELGRPLGAPGDRDTQRAVVSAALDLLASAVPPCTITEYEAANAAGERQRWEAPVTDVAGNLYAEVTALRARYSSSQQLLGRTTVGVANRTIDDVVTVVEHATRGERAGITKLVDQPYTLQLRYAVDDLKAYYLEAGAAGSMAPGSDELGSWFWRDSVGGRTLLTLRKRLLSDERKGLKILGGNFIVPRLWAERLGL